MCKIRSILFICSIVFCFHAGAWWGAACGCCSACGPGAIVYRHGSGSGACACAPEWVCVQLCLSGCLCSCVWVDVCAAVSERMCVNCAWVDVSAAVPGWVCVPPSLSECVCKCAWVDVCATVPRSRWRETCIRALFVQCAYAQFAPMNEYYMAFNEIFPLFPMC